MTRSLIAEYFDSSGVDIADATSEWIAYLASLDSVARQSPATARAIVHEIRDQRSNLKFIASENYSSLPVQLAMGNLLTDKYAEGAPHKRFYAGCDNVDEIEDSARESAMELFGVEHAYVQPHSGADANLVAFLAVLHNRIGRRVLEAVGSKSLLELSEQQWIELRREFGSQRLLGMDLAAGGHLTHGYRLNISALMFDVTLYGVDEKTGLLDYDKLETVALEVRPLILLVGYSAYPRKLDFARLKEIADRAGSVLLADMAHFAGLVAGKVFSGRYTPVGHADLITSTTHKTLRGPRGGFVLSTSDFASDVDKGCPYVLGGPLPNVMAAKAICFEEARREEFSGYAHRVVENAQILSAKLQSLGMSVVTGGTDNHLLLVDVRPYGLTGRQAESALRACGITLNRNVIPGDTNGPWYTSGLRFGTAAVTTLGMGREEMVLAAELAERVLSSTVPVPTSTGNARVQFSTPVDVVSEVRDAAKVLLARFPVYPELDLDFLEKTIGV
ncbi:MAG: aminotransferase class I/II-fold pyridoxal phosphate-dependent enzyme [Gammaproteobacteria bacterium]